MVEQRKSKLGVYVTSSEKYELNRYKNVLIASIPYPAVNFLKYIKIHLIMLQIYYLIGNKIILMLL